MRKENEDKLDPRRPALIVKYGNTRKKCRPLDRDLFVLGRAPGCDLGLISPEVAPVHCVLVRQPQGWRIRDCSGRGATQVNGIPVHEGPLCHGDIIQVGSFSFEAHLPGNPAHLPAADHAAFQAIQVERQKWERSRRNLAHHALRLRAELRQVHEDGGDLERQRADLEHQEDRLRTRVREYESRAAKLAQERKQLDESLAELEQLRAEVGRQQLAAPASVVAALPPSSEEARDLEIRARELEHYHNYLRRQADKLETVDLGEERDRAEVDRLREEVHARDELIAELSERLARNETFAAEDRAGYEAELNHYRLELERDRQVLEEQRREMALRQAEFARQRRELTEESARGAAAAAEKRLAVRRLRESFNRGEYSQPRPSGARQPRVAAEPSGARHQRVLSEPSGARHQRVAGETSGARHQRLAAETQVDEK